MKNGAKIFIHPVKNPSLYGVATLGKNKKVLNLNEKPKNSKSNLAVTGLYFFDNKVVDFTKNLNPQKEVNWRLLICLNFIKEKIN